MKTLTKIKILSLLLIGSLFFITSCKTTKKATTKSYEAKEAKELFSLVADNSLEYQTFSGKMKASVRLGKNNVDINAYLRIIKDEKLQLSLQMPILGEMFKLAISKDSLILIDRMNKQFVAESMQDIKQTSSFDFNLNNLQALFTNQLFLAGKPAVTTADFQLFTINQEKEQAFLTAKDKYINYTFTVDYTDHIKNSMMTGNSGKTTMNWSYDNFSPLENKRLFPMQMGMNLNSSTNKLSLNLAFSKIDLDKDIEIDFNIPKKYNRITLAQALILINSMKL